MDYHSGLEDARHIAAPSGMSKEEPQDPGQANASLFYDPTDVVLNSFTVLRGKGDETDRETVGRASAHDLRTGIQHLADPGKGKAQFQLQEKSSVASLHVKLRPDSVHIPV